MIKEITNPYHSPSRAVVLVRERTKRRQGRMWVGPLSVERDNIRSVEAFEGVEDNTTCTVMVRYREAPRRQRTHARMYIQGRNLGDLHTALLLCKAAKGRRKLESRRRTV